MLARLALAVGLTAGLTISHRPTTARWDAMGHHTIAAIAYGRLSPATRARVDSLLRRHPDFDSLAKGIALDAPDAGRQLFMRASVWPDVIRRDARFYDEANAASTPTVALSGFPNMQRHAGWHYVTRSFSTDGTPELTMPEPGTPAAIAALANALADNTKPVAERAYDLAWVVHVIGDLHQPLHGTSRSTSRQPAGDAGGNMVRVQEGPLPGDTMNLHAFWDGALTRGVRGRDAIDVANQLAVELPLALTSPALRVPDGPALAATIGAWAAESETLARYVVYDIDDRAPGAPPPALTSAYERQAQQIARQRVVLAGYRLAQLLESRLR